jgi:hypothetical protein
MEEPAKPQFDSQVVQPQEGSPSGGGPAIARPVRNFLFFIRNGARGRPRVFARTLLFKGKGPDPFKTSFRPLDPVPLFHDDFKKNSHVSLCCL